jgi:hypothetical protein
MQIKLSCGLILLGAGKKERADGNFDLSNAFFMGTRRDSEGKVHKKQMPQ